MQECIGYYINNRRDGSVGEFFTMILGSLDHRPITSCSQVIASSCIRDIGWIEEDTVALLKALEHHTDSMLDEHVLERVGPMLSSLPATQEFISWQLLLLSKALNISDSYWVHGNIGFSLSILQNTCRFVMKDQCRGNSPDATGLVNTANLRLILVPKLHEKLLKRSLVIHSNELYEILARSVLLSEDPAAVFHHVVSGLGPWAASAFVKLMASMDDISDATICNLRSLELDGMFIQEAQDAVVSRDTEKMNLCIACLSQKRHRGLVSQDCVKQASAAILDLMNNQDSIDSKVILLQLMVSIINYDDTILDSSEDTQNQVLTFTLQTAWEEFLLDLCEDPSKIFDCDWIEIVDNNKSLQAAQHILETQFSYLSWDSTPISEWVEEMLMPEIDSSGELILKDSHHNVPVYCLISCIVSSVPKAKRTAVLSVFHSILCQFPATAVKILEQSKNNIISDLTSDTTGLSLLSQIIYDCLETGICVVPLVSNIVEGQESYESFLQYQATLGDYAVDTMVLLLDAGLSSLQDSIVQVAIEFCKSKLFNMATGGWQCRVLTQIASSIRKNESLFDRSGLKSYAYSLLDRDVDEISNQYLVALGACMGQYDAACTHAWHPLHPGIPVWYSDSKSENEWKRSKILSRDDSIHPPSFVVESGTSVRETEPSRLRVAQFGVFSLPRPTRKEHIGPIVLYDTEEINKITSLIKHLSMRDDLFPLDAPGWCFVSRFCALPPVWNNLLPEERSKILGRISDVLSKSYSEIDAVVEELSGALVDKVNQAIGASFSNVNDTLRFMMGLQTNLKLRSVPKVWWVK